MHLNRRADPGFCSEVVEQMQTTTGLRRDRQERVVAPASFLLPCTILLGTGVSDRALPRVLVSIEELALTLAFPVSASPGLIEGQASHGR